jgi:glycosyltransferase involved in cell wall biosynthesis
VTDAQRNNLYSHATLFVFPTLYEGFGLPVIEAMSYGIPVLTSDIPIMREVGEDAALYADPKNPQDIATQISHILTNPERLSEYTQKSLNHYARFNSWKPGADIIARSMGLAK